MRRHDWIFTRTDGLQPLLEWSGTRGAWLGDPEDAHTVMSDMGLTYAGGFGGEDCGAVSLWRPASAQAAAEVPFACAAVVMLGRRWPMCVWLADEVDLLSFWERFGPFAALAHMAEQLELLQPMR